jgi:hypothetical protein
VVAAIVAVGQRPAPTRISTDRALVFPKVASALNEVASLEIRTPGRTFTVKREQGRWGIVELKGYPVQFDKVKTVLVELSQLRFLEPKTSDTARYDRLDLRDVTATGARSKYIIARDSKGAVLAEGTIGRRNDSLFGTGKGGTYLRLKEDKQTWLAEGILSLGAGPADWVSKQVVDIKGDEVRKIVVVSPKGGGVVVRREKKTDKDFKLDDIPQGKKQRGQWETNQMPKALEGLKLVDVRRADEVEFADGPYKGTVTTFDGLVVHTESAQVGKKYWARFSATTDASAGEIPDKVKKQAEEINARLKGYVYEIPEEAGKKLTCEHRNMLEGAGINACT